MLQPLRSNARRSRVSVGTSIPSPVEGWDAVSPLSEMNPKRAVFLENFFPQPGYVEVRRGFTLQADGMDEPVESLMAWHAPTGLVDSKLFAAAGVSIFDVTAAAAATDTSLTTGDARFQHVNFANSGGNYLWICNGVDVPRYYNGTTWTNTAITGTGITPASIIHVNMHKRRLWLTQKDSMVAAYLATDAITGAGKIFDFGPLFADGGYLMATGTWTIDGGIGVDDYFVAISSQGEVAVYKGTDPDSVDTWALVGVYRVGKPLGRRCFTNVGGDIALNCVDGVLPLSQALNFDRAAVSRVSLTTRIENAMNTAARAYGDNFGWQLISYPRGTMAILNVPVVENVSQQQFVMNTITGAWCKFSGINANCWELFGDRMFFGSNDGRVFEFDRSGADWNKQISASGQTAFNYMGSRGRLKQWKMAQPLILTNGAAGPGIGLATDFQNNANVTTPTASLNPGSVWDLAIWDQDVWPDVVSVSSDWISITGIGQAGAIKFVSLLGTNMEDPVSPIYGDDLQNEGEVQINSFNVIFEPGEFF